MQSFVPESTVETIAPTPSSSILGYQILGYLGYLGYLGSSWVLGIAIANVFDLGRI